MGNQWITWEERERERERLVFFLKITRLGWGKEKGWITRNEKWESVENLSRKEKGNQKQKKI